MSLFENSTKICLKIEKINFIINTLFSFYYIIISLEEKYNS
jgi:hypothetical protein